MTIYSTFVYFTSVVMLEAWRLGHILLLHYTHYKSILKCSLLIKFTFLGEFQRHGLKVFGFFGVLLSLHKNKRHWKWVLRQVLDCMVKMWVCSTQAATAWAAKWSITQWTSMSVSTGSPFFPLILLRCLQVSQIDGQNRVSFEDALMGALKNFANYTAWPTETKIFILQNCIDILLVASTR